MNKYRHEYKYLISPMQDVILRSKAEAVMQRDGHAKSGGIYQIESLYFDTIENRFFYENEDGVNQRIKYRIRTYNHDSSYIVLEKKTKVNGMTGKIGTQISADDCMNLIEGNYDLLIQKANEEQMKLYMEMAMLSLVPKVIVTYHREPFIYPVGNVRVTFDREITASRDVDRFLKGYEQRPIMNGERIMEVKWDEYLPEHIRGALQLDTVKWSTFSKYYYCRKYNSDGGLV